MKTYCIAHGTLLSQCYVAAWMGGEFEGEWIHVHVWLCPLPWGNIYPFECRVPQNSKERSESLPQLSVQRNRGKQWMGKTRDPFKKIRDTKRTFHARMGTIKDRNGMDLIEAEDIKKRWKEYTEELYKKDLQKPDNHNGAITHLEPDILKYEVKVGNRKHHYKQS